MSTQQEKEYQERMQQMIKRERELIDHGAEQQERIRALELEVRRLSARLNQISCMAGGNVMAKKNGVIYLTFNPSTPRPNAKPPSPPNMERVERRRVIEDHQERLRTQKENYYWSDAL